MVHYLQYKSWSIVSYRRQKGRHLEMRAYEHAVRDVTGETLDKFWDRLKFLECYVGQGVSFSLQVRIKTNLLAELKHQAPN